MSANGSETVAASGLPALPSSHAANNGHGSNGASNGTKKAGNGNNSAPQSRPATPRTKLAQLRTTTMFEARDAIAQNRDKPVGKWKIPEPRHGAGRRHPRAATLFLGKDHDRWMQYQQEKSGEGPSATGYMRAWHHGGTSSSVQVGHSQGYSYSDGDEDDAEDYSDEVSDSGSQRSEYYRVHHEASQSSSTGTEDESAFSAISSGGESSRRSSFGLRRRTSSSRGSRGQAGAAPFPKIQQSQAAGLLRESSRRRKASGTSSREGSIQEAPPSPRPRRFSSNGPEAAFLRHETVIGIHTPRRDSLASIASGFERVSLAPLSQIRTSSGESRQRSPSISSPRERKASSPSSGPKPRRELQPSPSSELLVKAANAAAAAVDKSPRRGSADRQMQLSSEDEQTSVPGIARRRHTASPRVALKLARRRRPIKVEGTLYDRSGPFREGAVTDGLCVRFFTAEDSSESAGFATQHHSSAGKDALAHAMESAVADEEMVPTTYLITTPDNRVSSAAKLRRWAMDGEGRFYAAMEIKSLEAKMRAADPQATNGSHVSKNAMREMRDRYLDDLLDEVQKAETLNADRKTVAKVLRTSDNKYLRLEEDYPEEAFFVVAGCDESELYPVIALVFSQAVRHIVRFHSAGWLHGDIKLENLMFDDQGQLVVIDYENANPYRSVPGGDGRVTLASYDWIPPEAYAGPHGRRAGPSADLWALGCNMVRAFALRDNVEDLAIRDTLLGRGQDAFLAYRRRVLLQRGSAATSADASKQGSFSGRRGSDVGIPGSATRPLPTADDVDLTPLQGGSDWDEGEVGSVDARYTGVPTHIGAAGSKSIGGAPASPASTGSGPPMAGPSPQRLLSRFARDAPDLLRLVLARCISDLPEERGIEAEMDCLRFVEQLEDEERRLGERSTLGVGRKAVRTAIDLSGSAWVRPKLDDARAELGLV